MKKIIYLALFICINNVTFSQNHGFSFNSIFRDNSGNPITNTEVDIVISIYQGNATSSPIYEEDYIGYETNFLGLINLKIGEADSIAFNSIDWSNPPYFLEVEVDGNVLNYSEILAVPIAMYAVYGEDDDADPTNEFNDSIWLDGNLLRVSDGGGTESVDLTPLTGAGTDNQNLTGATLTGASLQIDIEDGASITVDLAGLQDGTGTDNQNLTGATLTGASLQIDIENGTSTTVDLAGLQDGTGTDDQNITGSGLSGNTLTIGIEGGTSETVDLSSLNNSGTDNQNLTGATLTGTSLQIDIEDGTSTTVDLAGLQDGVDMQITIHLMSIIHHLS